MSEYELPGDQPLQAVIELQSRLSALDLVISPQIGQGDIDDLRYLKRRDSDEALKEKIGSLISSGENATVEFKTSIFTDIKKLRHNEDLSFEDCFSEKIFRKAASEIAAFANSRGGTIIFGVEDNGALFGVGKEIRTVNSGASLPDKADHCVKQLCEKHYIQPFSVMSMLNFSHCVYENLDLLVVEVPQSDKLVFLKNGGDQLYIRVGTSAVPIKYEQIESYFSISRT